MAGSASKTFLLIGKCIPTSVERAVSKVRVRRMELDTNLNCYFKKDEFYYAHDPEKVAKTGDVVLIQELPEKLTTIITHKLLNVVYKCGDVQDPITGKNVAGVDRGIVKFRDQIEKEDELYGKNPNRFEYDKAPPRGWQEDKKDFSHKKSYRKYNEDGKHQPYAIP
nr:PREDICTED: 28S ribosomal protein S17, mitochondrial [Bemisia tabaci]